MTKTIKDKILDSIPFGILVLSLDKNLLFINDKCKNLLNIKEETYFSSFDIFSILPELSKILNNNNQNKCIFKEHILSTSLNNKFICEISPFIENNIHIGYLILIKDTQDIVNDTNCLNTNNTRFTFSNIIYQSPQMELVIEQCKQIANIPSTVLIAGESGSGKELLAQSIHNSSSQKNGPFVAVNCGSIPKNLIESELFGYESGAFTGALKGGSPGKFELADGGTIFLDEIGEMPIEMQVHLLRVLQEGKITRISAKNSISINVRVIAATNKDLKEEVRKGNFRSDLYYRLNVLPINVPPLKDRIGDVPLLLNHFLEKKSKKLHKPIPIISQKLFKKMISYCWPGNVRELENFVENLVALNGITSYEINLADCHCLTYDNLGNKIKLFDNNTLASSDNSKNIITPLLTLEQNEIKKALCVCNGNMSKTALKLGISRNALYNKMKRYGISIDR